MNRRHFLTHTALAAAGAAQRLRADSGFASGFAECDISPDIGMEEEGGYNKSFFRSFHDPCKARAAVFADGGSRAAVVGIDAGMIGRELVKQARREIESRCGIPASAIMLAASHSHSSGPTGDTQPGEYDHAPPLIRKLAYEMSPVADVTYLGRVRAGIVKAVCEANSRCAPARCSFGFGAEDKVAFNRRIRMENGRTWTHPGKGNPDSLGYAGPVDPQVGVLGVWDASGKLKGCCVNFACHATTSPGGISANYIYYLEQAIRGTFGAELVVVFTAGASGDVTQVDNLSLYAEREPENGARFVGGRVGAEAVRVLLQAPPGEAGPVVAISRTLHIPRRRPSAARVRAAQEIVERGTDPSDAEWVFAKETLLLNAKLVTAPAAEVEVQAVQVGPAVFVSNPAEYFCAFGLDIKRRSSFPFTFPVTLANGYVGYVPTEDAFAETGGGYETRLTASSNLEVTAGTRIADASIQLCNSLRPGAVPEPPRAARFDANSHEWMVGPWRYGNVPPEQH